MLKKREVIISARGVYKTYRSGFMGKRKTEALRGIDLDIREGELFGVIGPNGAGKTTFLNILIGQLFADKGSVHVMGADVTRSFSNKIKERMNMCSGNPNFPWSLNSEEALRFYGMLYGFSGKDLEQKIEKNIGLFELDKYRKVEYDSLSTGNQQKLAMAKAMLNDPEILLLDEPTSGLDPDMAHKTRAFIKRIRKERKMTIILTTHYMPEAEELCERLAFIKNGKIVALGTKQELKKLTKTKDLEAMFIEIANQ
jgi:ABC-2 type transport system ATP-binding protein